MKTIATILLGLALCAPVCGQTTAGELKDDCKSNIKMLDPDHPKLPYKRSATGRRVHWLYDRLARNRT
jgi:hypothetical protein